MRLRIVFIFSLFPLFLNARVLTQPQTFAMVFHKSYCERFHCAIENYMHTVESNGYFAFYLCTDTVDINELKKRIKVKAKEEKADFSEISGINLFGPVTSTKTINYLKVSKNPVFPTSALMVANVELILSEGRDVLTDIKPAGDQKCLAFSPRHREIDVAWWEFAYMEAESAGQKLSCYFSDKQPYIARWVSHISPDKMDEDFSARLNEVSHRLAPRGSITTGESFKNSLQNNLSNSRTIPYYHYPNGEGTSILGMVSVPVLWIIGGLSRVREGYSFWNRFQTIGDKFGNSFIYLGLTVIGSFSVNSYFNTQYYLPYDNGWKKVLLKKPLTSDGLLKPYAETP